MTHPTREQIDELLRLEDSHGVLTPPAVRDRRELLVWSAAFGMARLLKAAGKDLSLLLYAMRVRSDNITPEWRERIEAVESLAALVRLGGDR